MKRKKLFTAGMCLIIASLLVITGTAVAKYKFSSSSGETVSKIINRVNITVSATEFSFDRVDKDGMLECRTVVTIEKTEPDFYGVLHSITIGGCEPGFVMYTAGKNNGDTLLPEDGLRPADVDGANPLEWEGAFTVPYEKDKNTYDVTLDINYSTGVKTNLAQRYMTSVPITINVS